MVFFIHFILICVTLYHAQNLASMTDVCNMLSVYCADCTIWLWDFQPCLLFGLWLLVSSLVHDVGAEAISFRSNCTVVGIKQQPDDLCKSVNMNALICQHMLCSHYMTLVLSVFLILPYNLSCVMEKCVRPWLWLNLSNYQGIKVCPTADS